MRLLPFLLLAAIVPACGRATAAPKEAHMVMTILEARVPPERAADVAPVFSRGAAELPPEIVGTWLVRDTKDPGLLRLCTVWRDRAALDAMRASGVKPKGVQMFEEVGAAPTLGIYDVVMHRGH